MATGVRSDVWNFFEKVKLSNKAKCTVCLKDFAYHGGTSNLREHLVSKHSELYEHKKKKDSEDQTRIDSFVSKSQCSASRAKEITDKIAIMIALDIRPISIIEGPGFTSLMQFLEPGYTIPSRKYLSKILKQKHEDGIEKLRYKLSNEVDTIALTTDIWTSCATEAYITITAHGIFNWEMDSLVLATRAFPERHTAIEIASKLKEVADEFNVRHKVTTVVHDQAANMELCCYMLMEEEGWISLKCTAHCLQLCLQSGFNIPVFSRLLAATRKIVGHFHHSVVATEELKRRCRQMELAEKKLVRDCATRWNSSFYMLERLLHLRWPVAAVLSDDNITKKADRYLDLKSEQWTLADDLVKLLQPFEVATTFFSYEANTSISSVLPVLHGLIISLQTSSEDSVSIIDFKKKVTSEIEKRWNIGSADLCNLLPLSSVVDPRFKNMNFLAEDDVEMLKVELLKKMSNYDIPKDEDEPQPKRGKSALDILLGPEEAHATVTINDELEIYVRPDTS